MASPRHTSQFVYFLRPQVMRVISLITDFIADGKILTEQHEDRSFKFWYCHSHKPDPVLDELDTMVIHFQYGKPKEVKREIDSL
jgi:hypothetical protein